MYNAEQNFFYELVNQIKKTFFDFREMVPNRVFRHNHYKIKISRRILGIIKQMFMYNSSFLTFFKYKFQFIHELIKCIYEIKQVYSIT